MPRVVVPLLEASSRPIVGDPQMLTQDERDRRSAFTVGLVSMPFATATRPSIQLGTLHATAASHGFDVQSFHLMLDFARRTDDALYENLGLPRAHAIGDWLFSVEAFRDAAPDPEGRLLTDVGSDLSRLLDPLGATLDDLRRLRADVVPAFLDAVVAETDWSGFAVIGFTTSFQQQVASLALARRIKEVAPETVIVFGGANVDGDMGVEWVRSMPVIDAVIRGEADRTFVDFLVELADGGDWRRSDGVVSRRDGELVINAISTPVRALDDIAIPDYGEYFDRAERLGLLTDGMRREVTIPFETSRGCWWGAKRHCTFCGLNNDTMEFRSKSDDRAFDELATLTKRYRSFRYAAVDNILERRYLDGLLPRLAASDSTYSFFYEVKADLRPEELQLLASAGVRRVQPGIESLSSRTLARMRKGVRASTNVNLLRWCRQLGITVGWNLIFGFPGEEPDEPAAQATLLPLLHHLEPPSGCSRIWLERFSPLFTDADSPVRWRRPTSSLRSVYPDHVDLDEAAYFFEYEIEGALDDESYAPLVAASADWVAAWADGKPPRLTWWSAPDLLIIEDERVPDVVVSHTFEGPLAALYRSCLDRPMSAATAAAAAGLDGHGLDAVRAALDEFTERGLMFRDGNLYLALALVAAPAGDAALTP